MQKLLLVYYLSKNRATSQIWKVLPNMVFPRFTFWACACKFQPLYGAGRKESSGTGLRWGMIQVPSRISQLPTTAEHCFVVWTVLNNLITTSPVPELYFLPAPYRGWTRAGERRVQDNLHAHAQNAAIFPPKSGENHIWKNFPDSACGAIFWIIIYKQQFLHSDWLKTCQLINPKSVEFHQCHAKPHSICFFYNIRDTGFADSWKHQFGKCTCMRCIMTNSLNLQNNTKSKTFGKRGMTRTRCR